MLTTYIRAMRRKQQLMFSMPFQAELRMCTFKADDVSSSSRQAYTTSTFTTVLSLLLQQEDFVTNHQPLHHYAMQQGQELT